MGPLATGKELTREGIMVERGAGGSERPQCMRGSQSQAGRAVGVSKIPPVGTLTRTALNPFWRPPLMPKGSTLSHCCQGTQFLICEPLEKKFPHLAPKVLTLFTPQNAFTYTFSSIQRLHSSQYYSKGQAQCSPETPVKLFPAVYKNQRTNHVLSAWNYKTGTESTFFFHRREKKQKHITGLSRTWIMRMHLWLQSPTERKHTAVFSMSI